MPWAGETQDYLYLFQSQQATSFTIYAVLSTRSGHIELNKFLY